MSDIRSEINTEPLKFDEAVQFFADKVTLTPREFYRLSDHYRSLAFTVSNYTKAQVLKKFRDEVLRAIEDGTTMETFRQNMSEFLVRNGYKGLTPFQADNIFRTNVQTAYQVGHYERMTNPETLRLRPYWQYVAVQDSRTRPAHLAMDGKVFPADSPVWDTWYPPNGYRCRCTVVTLSKRQVEQRGLRVETEVPRGEELPDGRFIPIRPDHHFASNPAKVKWTPDMTDYPESIRRAFEEQQNQPPSERD